MFSVETLEERSRSLVELLESPRWALAQPLAARAAGRGAATFDAALAARRLARWKESGPFAKYPALWEEKLAAAQLAEDALLRILGETPEDGQRPAWVGTIAEAYGAAGSSEFLGASELAGSSLRGTRGTEAPEEPPPAFPWPAGTDLDRCRFLALVEPLVWHFCSRLELEARSILAADPQAPFTPDIARVLTAHLPDHFAALLNRACVVEMHALRLEERLHGDTAEERFADFLRHLSDPEYALEVLEQYPVLAHQAVQRLELWFAACLELLQRLAADAHAIASRFGTTLGTLRGVEGAISDFHRGGRAVFILSFDSGFELVYKPKPLALEAAFQRLLGWLNARGFAPEFRAIAVLDRGDYGWMERVHTAPCPDEAALLRFLERQGGYLALLYALDGTDFHHENLLASGEHPVLIDLETLFQPWLNARDLREASRAPGAPLRSTVLRPNLLPERWYGDAQNAGVDLSGLTAVDGQLTPRPMLAATDSGLDTMRMERRRMKIPAGENRARVEHGRDLAAHELAAPIEAGFRRMYALLSEHRDAFLAELDAFADCETRLLFRTTMSYGTVLLESLHPHALGNALERDRLFDTLWTAADRRPYLSVLFPFENEDLHRGDIPLFITRPGTRDAFHWSGARFAGFFEQSGLERVTENLRAFSPRDCERQVAVLRDTFDALRISSPGVARPSYAHAPRETRPQPDELLALARRAGDRIVERAFEDDAQAHWLILDYRDPDGWTVVPAHPDVWLGLPGIALFLGTLGVATHEARYVDVARKALFAQRQQLAADPSKPAAVGAFNGWGGIISTLAHLGSLWQDDALLDEAESYARSLPPRIAADGLLDVIMGSAGCALSLLALSRVRPSPMIDDALRACGERLLATAQPQSVGIGWPIQLAGNRALAGISHGAAGIALALLQLADRFDDARFRDAALQAIAFERSLYDASERNWPDLRVGAEGVDAGSERFMWAWCHGAPGIGLARIAGLPLLDDDAVRGEIDVALHSTLDRGFGDNHTLCHGDLGNLEFVFAAAEVLGDRGLEQRAWRIAGGIADSIHRDGWLMGLPGNIETPGLMAGLAGIGYGLGRLARPDVFPRLLTPGL